MFTGRLVEINDHNITLEISSDEQVKLSVRFDKLKAKTDRVSSPFRLQDGQHLIDANASQLTIKSRRLIEDLVGREIRVSGTYKMRYKQFCNRADFDIFTIEYDQECCGKVISIPLILTE